MELSRQWIVTRLDGKVAAVSTDYKSAARVLSRLSPQDADSVSCEKLPTEAVFDLADSLTWEDLRLVGSPFQLSVWHKLFDLSHGGEPVRLVSYSDLADSLGKAPGVRAVAHAVGLNPCNVIVPCHLVIPKESLERLRDLEDENSLFKWETLYMVDRHVNYGEYSLGAALKRRLIQIHLNR